MNKLTLEEKLQTIVGAMDIVAGGGISLDRLERLAAEMPCGHLEINAADYDAIIKPELEKGSTPSTRVMRTYPPLGYLMGREIVAVSKNQREVWPSGRVPRGVIWQRSN